MCDQAHFHLNEYINKQNSLFWDIENIRETYQQQFHSQKYIIWFFLTFDNCSFIKIEKFNKFRWLFNIILIFRRYSVKKMNKLWIFKTFDLSTAIFITCNVWKKTYSVKESTFRVTTSHSRVTKLGFLLNELHKLFFHIIHIGWKIKNIQII